MNDVPYLLRGVQQVESEASNLTSSSKYLNNLFLRDWLPFILLRKNGPDIPPPAEMGHVGDEMRKMRDYDRIEAMFTAERKINPKLDAWFEERFISTYTIDDLARYEKGTVGGTFHEWITEGNYEIQVRPWKEPKSQLEFYELRSAQTHDLEHIICGGGFNFVGELVPYWMRLTNVFRYFHDQELAGELSHIQILGQLRYTVRTVLHYPQVWQYTIDAIKRGIDVGQQSEALFMFKYEDVFHLPVAEAREVLGVRGAVDRDTWLAGEVFAERADPAELPLPEWIESPLTPAP